MIRGEGQHLKEELSDREGEDGKLSGEEGQGLEGQTT